MQEERLLHARSELLYFAAACPVLVRKPTYHHRAPAV